MRIVGAAAACGGWGNVGWVGGGAGATAGGAGATAAEAGVAGAAGDAVAGAPLVGNGAFDEGATCGGAGVGGGIAIGGITGRDRGGCGPPTSTERLTTTVGDGWSLGEDGGATGGAGAFGPAILVVAVLASLLSGTRFEKVLIEDFAGYQSHATTKSPQAISTVDRVYMWGEVLKRAAHDEAAGPGSDGDRCAFLGVGSVGGPAVVARDDLGVRWAQCIPTTNSSA
jgi:hypothetical protein